MLASVNALERSRAERLYRGQIDPSLWDELSKLPDLGVLERRKLDLARPGGLCAYLLQIDNLRHLPEFENLYAWGKWLAYNLSPHYEEECDRCLSKMYSLHGDYGNLVLAYAHLRRGNFPFLDFMDWYLRMACYFVEAGFLDHARRYTNRAREVAASAGSSFWEIRTQAIEGSLSIAEGRVDFNHLCKVFKILDSSDDIYRATTAANLAYVNDATSGCPQQTMAMIREAMRHRAGQEDVMTYRLHWLRGNSFAKTDDPDAAIDSYEQARKGFRQAGLLDLDAVLCLDAGKHLIDTDRTDDAYGYCDAVARGVGWKPVSARGYILRIQNFKKFIESRLLTRGRIDRMKNFYTDPRYGWGGMPMLGINRPYRFICKRETPKILRFPVKPETTPVMTGETSNGAARATHT